MYSQNNEEEIILSKFGNNGNFLDIGAYDGKTFSNTFALLERGWTGVMVEPSPIVFLRLKENTKAFSDKVSLVNSAIELESKIMEFYDSNGDALSTTSTEHKRKWETGSKSTFSKFFIKTMTLEDVVNKFGDNFDFINIDVEGQNFHLFERLFSMIKNGKFKSLKMLCIEHDGENNKIMNSMKALGFSKILFNGENVILWKS